MDYWEYPGAGGDETFGFFNVGLSLGIPRSAVPEEDGSWEVAAGIQHVTRGDGLTAINGTDDDLNLLQDTIRGNRPLPRGPDPSGKMFVSFERRAVVGTA